MFIALYISVGHIADTSVNPCLFSKQPQTGGIRVYTAEQSSVLVTEDRVSPSKLYYGGYAAAAYENYSLTLKTSTVTSSSAQAVAQDVEEVVVQPCNTVLHAYFKPLLSPLSKI